MALAALDDNFRESVECIGSCNQEDSLRRKRLDGKRPLAFRPVDLTMICLFPCFDQRHWHVSGS